MRDPKRIPHLSAKFQEAWSLVPDWRMGQLLSNLLGAGQQDVFHVEDDEWEQRIDLFLKNYGRPNEV